MTNGAAYPPPGQYPVTHGTKELKCEFGHLAINPADAPGWFMCEFNHAVEDKPEEAPD